MPTQSPIERTRNFEEVALGYTEAQAVAEAERCLGCKRPKCIEGCPVEIEIQEFIGLIRERDFLGAISKIKEKNSLPAICGRVCPQETQCERLCLLGKKDEPIAIGGLERFVADYEAKESTSFVVPNPPHSRQRERVAIVGSGPAGLTCAGELARLGYIVTIFEGLHATGGVLRYGIPPFRLPKEIVDREVDYIKSLGVEIKVNMVIGKTMTIEDLFEEGFLSVFIGSGAGAPLFMDIPGEDLNGVYSANEFLTRCNLMGAYMFPVYDTPIKIGKRVVVVGGGNVALDSARVALRLGAEEVNIVYRRGKEEMPARREEVHHAEEEGVIFRFLANPVRIIGDNEGWVKEIECLRMKLGEVDRSGRRRPIPIPGSEFLIEAETVIIAIGQGPNPILFETTPGLRLNEKGYIVIDEEGRTSMEGVYAGGDIVTGAATVISAMGAGKMAARTIHNDLKRQSKAIKRGRAVHPPPLHS
jgi:glutamate synthase (NADPH/NADH) small chain